MATKEPLNAITARMLDQNVIKPTDVWLDTKSVAAITGFSPKWLEAAREGRKGIHGPRFRKMNEHARTSPVRYNLADVREWMESFPSYQTISQIECKHGDFSAFMSDASPTECWPFVVQEGSNRVELFKAINSGLLGGPDKQPTVEWITKRELAKYSVVSE